jgi:myo-inositol-1(or 4)-monophosphatase
LLGTAWNAANGAGEIFRASWLQPKTIDCKSAVDLVTSVDKECESKIVAMLRRDFPQHSILAEERKRELTAESGITAGSSIR